MTISSTNSRNDYVGSAITGPYSYSFRIAAATDLVVTTRDALGNETVLAYGSDYTVSGVNAPNGGTITLSVALPTGYALSLRRVVDLVQETDLRNQGTFFPEVHEDVFDRLTMIDQQQQDDIGRSFKLPTTVDPNSVDPTLPAPSALSVLGWNGLANRLVNYVLEVASMIAVPVGRLVNTVTQYLQNSAEFNVADYYSTAGVLPVDGTTSIRTAILAALAAAQAKGGGRVILPYTPQGYNIGSTSPVNILIPSNITLECPTGILTLKYSGTGLGIDTLGASYTALRNIIVQCSNDAASGIRWGGSSVAPSFWCRMDNVMAQGSGTLGATGSGFILDSGPFFCAYLNGRQCYSLGFKYGLDVIGQSGGSHTWTTVKLDHLVLVGRSAGIVVGSRGIRCDANSNLQSSSLPNVVIEGFEQSYEYANASPGFGFSMPDAGIEGNTTNFPTPPSAGYAGKIEDFHSDYQFSQTCNGPVNIWMRRLIQTGLWLTESFYSRLHALYDGSSDTKFWGVQRGGSPIAGEYAADKFIVATGAQGDVGVLRNWHKFLEFKTTYSPSLPTVGTFGVGSRVWQAAPAAGVPVCWDVNSSGTLKSSPGNTASTTSGSPNVTVSAISTLERNDYITIAGAFSSPTRIKSISGTTLVMESNASGTVSGVAVVYPAPTFLIPARYAGMSADRGDASVILTIDEARTQRFLSALTGNRTCKLPAPLANPLCNGDKWRIFRQGLGAFTLTVQDQNGATLKVMPSATAAWCDIECDYTGTYYLTGYGTL